MSRNLNKYFLLIIFLVSNYSRAGTEDIFQPPPPEMQNTKYAQDCGGTNEDLSAEMPPTENQMQSPYCTTFEVKALIDYQFHVTHPADHYTEKISAMDLTSWSENQAEKNRGEAVDFSDGDTAFNLLESAQQAGSLYSDHDLPFDQSYFDNNGTLAQLDRYFSEFKSPRDIFKLACARLDPGLAKLENQFKDLKDILRKSVDAQTFISSVAGKHPLQLHPLPGSKRKPLDPAFNIRRYFPATGDQFLDELRANLADKKPSGVSICMTQLEQTANLESVPNNEKKKCGDHGIVVTGMKPINGQCNIELQNSWGTDWPAPPHPGGGFAWVPVTDFLKALHKNRDDTSILSISRREKGKPMENTQIFPSLRYSGGTKAGAPEGNGQWTSKDKTLTGVFTHGYFKQGKLQGKVNQGTYTGEAEAYVYNDKTHKYEKLKVDNGSQSRIFPLPSGKGELKTNQGATEAGIFAAGVLADGIHSGPWDAQYSYDGKIKNGIPDGEGRVTGKNGEIFEGIFSRGILLNGKRKRPLPGGGFSEDNVVGGHVNGQLLLNAFVPISIPNGDSTK